MTSFYVYFFNIYKSFKLCFLLSASAAMVQGASVVVGTTSTSITIWMVILTLSVLIMLGLNMRRWRRDYMCGRKQEVADDVSLSDTASNYSTPVKDQYTNDAIDIEEEHSTTADKKDISNV